MNRLKLTGVAVAVVAALLAGALALRRPRTSPPGRAGDPSHPALPAPRSPGSAPNPAPNPGSEAAPGVSARIDPRRRVEELVDRHRADPGELLKIARDTTEDVVRRAALLAFALLRDPSPELLEFVHDRSLPEGTRSFAVSCLAMARASFPRENPRVWDSLGSRLRTPAHWPLQVVQDETLRLALWDAGLEGPGYGLLDTVIRATTDADPSQAGRIIPVALGGRILDLARRSQDADGRTRAMVGLAHLVAGRLDEATRRQVDGLIAEALAGASPATESLYLMASTAARAGRADVLVDWYGRAGTPEARLQLANALHDAASPESSDAFADFLARAAETATAEDVGALLIQGIARTGPDRGFAALSRCYEVRANDPYLRGVILSSLASAEGLAAERRAWVAREAGTSLSAYVGSPDGDARSVRLLSSVLSRIGGPDDLALLRSLARPAGLNDDVRKTLQEAAEALQARLSGT